MTQEDPGPGRRYTEPGTFRVRDRSEDGADRVEIEGWLVPTRLQIWTAKLTATAAYDGDRFVLVHFEAGDPGYGPFQGWEALDVGWLIEMLNSDLPGFIARCGAFPGVIDPVDGAVFADQVRAMQNRRKITPSYLEEVARIYGSDPMRPTQAVAKKLDISRAHASRLVRKARDAGLIDKVTS